MDGKKQALEKPADIHPVSRPTPRPWCSSSRTPFGDMGKTYRFRVVYSPPDGPKVKRSWDLRLDAVNRGA